MRFKLFFIFQATTILLVHNAWSQCRDTLENETYYLCDFQIVNDSILGLSNLIHETEYVVHFFQDSLCREVMPDTFAFSDFEYHDTIAIYYTVSNDTCSGEVQPLKLVKDLTPDVSISGPVFANVGDTITLIPSIPGGQYLGADIVNNTFVSTIDSVYTIVYVYNSSESNCIFRSPYQLHIVDYDIPNPPMLLSEYKICSNKDTALVFPDTIEFYFDRMLTEFAFNSIVRTSNLSLGFQELYAVTNIDGRMSNPVKVSFDRELNPQSPLIIGPEYICEGSEYIVDALPQSVVWLDSTLNLIVANPGLIVDTSYNAGKHVFYAYSMDGFCSSDTVSYELEIRPFEKLHFDTLKVCVGIDTVSLLSFVDSLNYGYFEGIGVVDNLFYPSELEVGTHKIHYRTNSSDHCVSYDSLNVLVQSCNSLSISFQDYTHSQNEWTVSIFKVNNEDYTLLTEIKLPVDGNLTYYTTEKIIQLYFHNQRGDSFFYPYGFSHQNAEDIVFYSDRRDIVINYGQAALSVLNSSLVQFDNFVDIVTLNGMKIAENVILGDFKGNLKEGIYVIIPHAELSQSFMLVVD